MASSIRKWPDLQGQPKWVRTISGLQIGWYDYCCLDYSLWTEWQFLSRKLLEEKKLGTRMANIAI